VTAWGRAVRLAMTALVAVALLAGTVAGDDIHFPFGPFRMFSTTDRVDAPVNSTRVEAVDASGRGFVLSETLSGLRRAEIEGHAAVFGKDPALLRDVAEAYQRRHPDQPPLRQVTVVVRKYALRGGVPTGDYEDTVLATWQRR